MGPPDLKHAIAPSPSRSLRGWRSARSSSASPARAVHPVSGRCSSPALPPRWRSPPPRAWPRFPSPFRALRCRRPLPAERSTSWPTRSISSPLEREHSVSSLRSDRSVSFEGCSGERRLTKVIGLIRRRAALEQQTHDRGVPVIARQHEEAVALLVACAGGKTEVEERLQAHRVAGSRMLEGGLRDSRRFVRSLQGAVDHGRLRATASATRCPYSGSALRKCAIDRSMTSLRLTCDRLPAMFSTSLLRASSGITR